MDENLCFLYLVVRKWIQQKRLCRQHERARVIQRAFRRHLYRKQLLKHLSRFLDAARRARAIMECNSGTSVDSTSSSSTTFSPIGVYLDLGALIQTAMNSGVTLYLSKRLEGAKYLEYRQRILSKRRLPRVAIMYSLIV